jgi:hypothetical protein
MSSASPSYFAGAFNVGANPDWERVAKMVDLLRANGVRIEILRAEGRGGSGEVSLPFLASSGTGVAARLLGGCDPRATIVALSPYDLVAYTRVDPKKAGAQTLSAMARLSDENQSYEAAKASELCPNLLRRTSPEAAFDGLVGLDRQITVLRKLGTLVAKHGRGSVECLHMAFTGAPGTGKTELARRMLGYLDAAGVTDGSGTFVKASASDLVARYVGHTPSRTRAVVERALGGMLFIDEAYTLMEASSFGQEAIDTLVDLIEEYRDRLVCVVAGYPDKIDELLAANHGLRDRFGFRVQFDDYSDAELARIFDLFAAKHGFAVDPCARGAVEECAGKLRRMDGFANARSIRRLFDRAAIECACRSDEPTIKAADVRAAWEQPDMGGSKAAVRVGFAM